MFSRNRLGPNTQPWGTPHVTFRHSDLTWLIMISTMSFFFLPIWKIILRIDIVSAVWVSLTSSLIIRSAAAVLYLQHTHGFGELEMAQIRHNKPQHLLGEQAAIWQRSSNICQRLRENQWKHRQGGNNTLQESAASFKIQPITCRFWIFSFDFDKGVLHCVKCGVIYMGSSTCNTKYQQKGSNTKHELTVWRMNFSRS